MLSCRRQREKDGFAVRGAFAAALTWKACVAGWLCFWRSSCGPWRERGGCEDSFVSLAKLNGTFWLRIIGDVFLDVVGILRRCARLAKWTEVIGMGLRVSQGGLGGLRGVAISREMGMVCVSASSEVLRGWIDLVDWLLMCEKTAVDAPHCSRLEPS